MAKSVALLLNSASANGRSARSWPRIATALQQQGCDVRPLLGLDADRSLELAQKAVADGVDALVAVGGDGTVGVALQAVVGTQTALGIIPLGSGNDNARMLGIPAHPARACRLLTSVAPRRIDVGSATTDDGDQRFFLSVLAVGLDSRANERANEMSWPQGESRYLIAGLAELARQRPVDFTITVDGEVLSGPSTLVAVGNGMYYGGGMRICQGAVIDDGFLTMTWVRGGSRRELLRHIVDIYRGTHLKHPEVSQHLGREFRIEAPGQVAYAEGDRVGATPVTVRVHPGAVQVLAPVSG